jgi:hypothetical protein
MSAENGEEQRCSRGLGRSILQEVEGWEGSGGEVGREVLEGLRMRC